MNLMEQFGEMLKPHSTALSLALAHHSDRIVRHLSAIATNTDERPGIDDYWQRFTVAPTVASVPVEFQPELRVPLNEIWLVQSVAVTFFDTSAAILNVVNDNGQNVISKEFNYSGTVTQGGDTIIAGGAIALMPGEHLTMSDPTPSRTGVVLQIIRKQMNIQSKMPNLGPKTEMVSDRNTHPIDRDFDGRHPLRGWVRDPERAIPSEGRTHAQLSGRRLNDGLLDPTQV